ncbi:MAG: gliding motility-associated C-terminal domain-containing protein [Bacteroidota bacterium]|nr:gliding motility-associated C-terminal domain-containing protein [Bacteroidota bacterium]
MKTILKSFLTICLSLGILISYGQGGEGNNWYFGNYAGMTFNFGPPVALTDGAMSTYEGCASISDPAGNLLFYTDGILVYNSLHATMSNSVATSPGGSLNGDPSATQSGVIVPMPMNPQFYFIFTVDANIGTYGCRYSVVNMAAAGGYGNVVLGNKNSLLFTPSSEKITAVNHSNNYNIWVITHPWNSGSFNAYTVTPMGLNPVPVTSNVGSFYSGSSAVTRGYLQASPDGTYIAAGIEGLDKYELFHFDASTGVLTNFISMNANYQDAYGVEFSPDGTILYGSRRWGNPVFQWNLASGLPGQIMFSQTQVATLSTNYGGALQLAPDGKIYLARSNQGYLGVINAPNNLGAGVTGCNYVEPGIYLLGKTSREGLPTFIASFFNLADYEYIYQCVGDTTEFFMTDTINLDSAFWYFDDPMSGSNISWLWEPNHVFSDTGIFEVMLITYRGGLGDTAVQQVEIFPYPIIPLGNDTSVCTGSTITLNAGNPGAEYFWFNSSTSQSVSVTPPDTAIYWVEVIANQCLSADSITVTPFDITSSFIKTDLLCYQDEITITYTGNASQFATYNWNFSGANIVSGSGQGPYVIFWTDPGTYNISLLVQQGSCYSDTTSYSIINPPGLELGISGDDVTCFGESTGSVYLTVSGGDGFYSYQWSAGYSADSLSGVPAGFYSVSVSYNLVCIDTISYTINEPATPVEGSIIGSNIECFGENNGQADLTPIGGTPPYSYQWSIASETLQDMESLVAGYYTVTILDSHECQYETGVLIEEPDLLVAETSLDVTICDGESVTISAEAVGGVSPYIFNWTDYGAANSITVTPTNVETTYYVQAVDSNNCLSEITSVIVTLHPHVSTLATVQADSICLGDSTVIFANISGGNGGPYTCFIEGEEITVPFIVKPEVTTSYLVKGIDDCGSPTDSMLITIVVMDIPGTSFYSDIVEGCEPLEVNFFDSDSEPGQTYIWNFGETNEHNYSIEQNPAHIYQSPGTYDVILRTVSAFGCEFKFIFPDMITVYEKPNADFRADPVLVSILKPNVYFENLSIPYINSYWSFGDGVGKEGHLEETWHAYSDTGIFIVNLIVETSDLCRDTISMPIRVYDETGILYTPNAFNPNSNTEENRTFRPHIYGVDENHYHMIIYDRWGEKIYETFNYHHGWDGRVKNGEIAKIGAYPWIIIYRDLNGKPQKEKGSILVIDN